MQRLMHMDATAGIRFGRRLRMARTSSFAA
jgi:hypothetical protein